MDPEIRKAELRCACAALGAEEPIFLGYRDSGMENWERKPGTFADADREEVVGRIVDEMRRLRPAVVVTFDPGGIYGHPDHVRVSDVATEAFHRAHAEPGGPVSLYHHGLPRSAAEAMAAGWGANDDKPDAKPPTEDDLLQRRRFVELARPDEDITTTIDVRAGLARKRAAFDCHASQLRGDDFEFEGAEGAERMEEMFGTELFIRVVPTPDGGRAGDLVRRPRGAGGALARGPRVAVLRDRAVLDDEAHGVRVADPVRIAERIVVDGDQVGDLAGLQRAEVMGAAHQLGGHAGRRLDRRPSPSSRPRRAVRSRGRSCRGSPRRSRCPSRS